MDLDGSCPWNVLPVNLNGVRLEIREKIWLGNEIVAHGKQTSEVAQLFNLSPRTIRKYAHCVRDNKCLYKCGNRPRIIDKLGMQSIVVSNNSSVHVSRSQLGDDLLRAHQETCKRRVGNIPDENLPVRLAKRTRRRYTTLIHEIIDNVVDVDEVLSYFE